MMLVLWDIDKTLVDIRALGQSIFAETLARILGRRTPPPAGHDGWTDLAIIADCLQSAGIDAEAAQRLAPAGLAIYDTVFFQQRAAVAAHGRVLPGAAALIAELDRHPGLVQTVVTGNTRASARLKLDALGLGRPLRLDIGAFGDEATVRSDLVALARERAGVGDWEPTVVVGDTPQDIAAARAASVGVVAVTTGRFGPAALAGADAVLTGLEEPGAAATLLEVAHRARHRRRSATVVVDLASAQSFFTPTQTHLAWLAERFPTIDFQDLAQGADLPTHAEIYWGWRPEPAWLAASGTRWVCTPAAGIDQLGPLGGATVSRSLGWHGRPIAEHVMGLVLGIGRCLFTSYRLQSTQNWWKEQVAAEFTDTAGTRMAIVGFGPIGRAIAELAVAAGMSVTGISRTRPDDPSPAEWAGPDRAAAVLAGADVVVNALPATSATRAWFDRDRFACFKNGAVFINIGRAATVDETALIEALDGPLAWCALDVHPHKPLPPGHPLRSHPRAVLTPKTAVFTRAFAGEATRFFADELERYLTGQPLAGAHDNS